MVLTIKNFESQNVGPGVVETAPTNLVGVAGTLKATLTWTSATGESGVTWTEEKLVRKEGSAPSGSMDGDVVATITTKDTYSSTGYEDTGLDSTKTYYYKVFAIYDNGTERGSSDVNVTPIFPIKGIFHNETLGLISLSSDGTNWTTIADKNLGATQVYNDGDTISEDNCGKFYQWGNNYGFPFNGTFSKSSTKPNASGYVSNYSNSTFITTTSSDATKDWSSTINNNLWGGEGTTTQRKGPCATGFHIPTNTELNVFRTLASMIGGNISNYIKMPEHRYILYSGGYMDTYKEYYFWTSSTQANSSLSGVYNVYIFNGAAGTSTIFKTGGQPIRPFKNEPVVPTSERKVLYWTE